MWWKKIFRKNIEELPQPDIVKELAETKAALVLQLEELKNSLDDQFKDSARNLRRIGIAQKQQIDDQDSIKQEIFGLRKDVMLSNGVCLSINQAFQFLDQIDKIASTTQNNDVALNLLKNMQLEILDIFEIEPFVEIGEAYPDEGCSISAAIEDATSPEGTICEILQQGYTNYEGELLREAIVIVTKDEQKEEDENV